MTWFEPNLILFVGVAGGVKDVALGDVVAADKVYGYEYGRDDRSFLPRPAEGLSKRRLVDHARYVASSGHWRKRLPRPVAKLQPKALVGPLAAGEKVIASRRSATYRFLRRSYSDAVAVEMEGLGVLMAAHFNDDLPAIVIRGVSDLIDDKKPATDVEWQPVASQAAAAFAFEFLSSMGDGAPNGLKGPGPTGPRSVPQPYINRLRTIVVDDGALGSAARLMAGREGDRRFLPGELLEPELAVEAILGEGGFSTVYACRHVVEGMDLGLVAVKVHPRDLLHYFEREARVLSVLHHSALLPVRAIGQTVDGRPYTVTPLAEATLDQRLSQGPLPIPDVTAAGANLADGLAYLHGEGLVHGDIKPANIFLLRGQWVLGDFSLTHRIGEEQFAGTPIFMSPEALGGQSAPPGDVYSLGLSLLVSSIADAPLSPLRLSMSLGGIAKHMVGIQVDVPAELPSGFASIIRDCIQPTAAERPSAVDLARRLRALVPT